MMSESIAYIGLDNLPVWQQAIDFAARVCRDILPGMPVEEKDALAVQLRRSAQSVPASIAASMGRHQDEGVRFGYQARGYLEESRSHLELARRLEYVSDGLFQQISAEISGLLALVNRYIADLNRSRFAPAVFDTVLLPDTEGNCCVEVYEPLSNPVSELDTMYFFPEYRLPDLGI